MENASKIHYIVNGDFYNTGTSTIEIGAQIGGGESTSVGFKLSRTDDLFRYYYGELDLRFPY